MLLVNPVLDLPLKVLEFESAPRRHMFGLVHDLHIADNEVAEIRVRVVGPVKTGPEWPEWLEPVRGYVV
jgi:hypothetical protein